jgi:uncharacterized protein
VGRLRVNLEDRMLADRELHAADSAPEGGFVRRALHRAAVVRMSDSLLEFPCDFPLKVMGRREAASANSSSRWWSPMRDRSTADRVRELRESRDGNFVSLTLTGAGREPGAARRHLRRAVSAHDQVLMVL